jgi:hypothetical protein
MRCALMEWIYVAPDREQLRSLVKTEHAWHFLFYKTQEPWPAKLLADSQQQFCSIQSVIKVTFNRPHPTLFRVFIYKHLTRNLITKRKLYEVAAWISPYASRGDGANRPGNCKWEKMLAST